MGTRATKMIHPWLSRDQLNMVMHHYCIAAVWADSEEGTSPRVPSAERAKARKVVLRFIEQCEAAGNLFTKAMGCFDQGYGQHPDAGSAEAAFGHDFWLTRQGHGVGFWDRSREGLPEALGDLLTEQAKLFGECQMHQQYRGWWYFNEE